MQQHEHKDGSSKTHALTSSNGTCASNACLLIFLSFIRQPILDDYKMQFNMFVCSPSYLCFRLFSPGFDVVGVSVRRRAMLISDLHVTIPGEKRRRNDKTTKKKKSRNHQTTKLPNTHIVLSATASARPTAKLAKLRELHMLRPDESCDGRLDGSGGEQPQWRGVGERGGRQPAEIYLKFPC
jgi:hypothetical protein